MAVTVNNEGLSFVSSLDNSDFQTKMLQDIKLVQTQLQLTGDTSAIGKYDAAVTAALAAEARLRTELSEITNNAIAQVKAYSDQVKAPSGDNVFDNISVSAEKALSTIEEFQTTGNVALSGVDELLKVINDDFANGVISATEYKEALDSIGTFDGFKQQEQDAINAKIAIEEELGIIESLKAALIELKAENITIVDPVELAASNLKIQEVTAELTKAGNAGKLGFDEFGEKIIVVNEELEASIGLIGSIEAQLNTLKASKFDIVNINELKQVNAVIQDLEGQLGQFKNVGKAGFDEFGNAIDNSVPKATKFQAAISKAIDTSSIGAKVVTSFSRQIIGLATGFLSLEIGAKAIESLIKYVENLDAFTGRLDVAKQSLLAFNEIQDNAAKSSAGQLSNLKILSEAVENVASSMNNRLAAAQELKKEFPTEFENSTALQLVNGGLAKSYDDVRASIIAKATAAAQLTKITELEGQKQALVAQQIEIQAKANSDKASARGSAASTTSLPGGGGQYIASITPAQQQKGIQELADYQKNKINPAIKAIDDTIDAVINASGGATKLASAIGGANKVIQGTLAQFDVWIAKADDKTALDQLKTGLQAKLDALAPGDSQIAAIRSRLQQVDDLLKNYSVKATKTGQKDPGIALLASQTSVLGQIDALKAKYAAKDETRNQEAQDQITADFKKQAAAIDAQNVKYANYLKNHTAAQAASAGLKYIDPTSLAPIEADAHAGLAGTQAVDALKIQIDQQKAIFAEYEAYKLKAGTDAANQLYGNELNGYKSYIAYLNSLEPTEAQLTSTDPKTKSTTSKTQDLLVKERAEANTAELVQQQKHLGDLLFNNQDYEQKRQTIIVNGQADVAALQKAGDTEGAIQSAKNTQDKLDALGAANLKTTSEYKELFDGIQELTTQQFNDDVTLFKRRLDSAVVNHEISLEEYQKYYKQLDALQLANNNKQPDELIALGSAIGEIGKSFQGINSSIASYLQSLGSMAVSIGNVSKVSNKLTSDQADLAAGLKGAGDAVSADKMSLYTTALSGVLDIVGNIISASAARKKADEDYYNSVITFQQQYNVALDEQVRLQYQTAQGSIFYTDTAKELSDAVVAYDAADKQYKASVAALQQGQAIVGTHNAVSGANVAKDAGSGAAAGAAIGAIAGVGVLSVPAAAVGAIVGGLIGGAIGIFAGKKKVDTLAPLLSTYPQLIDANGKFNESLAKTLVANNQVTDATKTLLNNTIAYYDEEKTALDQITSTLTDMVGQLGTNISNALVTAFENGTDAAMAFKQAVSDMLSQIIQQDLFVAVFGQSLDALQTKLVGDVMTGGTNTQAEIIADITNFYKTAQGLVPDFTAGLQAAQSAGNDNGLNLFPASGSSTPTTATGQIQASLTEATGDLIFGSLKGIQLNTFQTNIGVTALNQSFGQMLNIAGQGLVELQKISANTKRSADTLDDNLPAIADSISKVAANTASTAASDLRAGGKFGF